MKFFPAFSLRNPVAIVLLVILIAVGGGYATSQFQQEQMPEVVFPGIMVAAVYPGAAPNEVLNEITLPLEKLLRNVDGVKSVTSQSANNVSQLQLEFGYNDDMNKKKELVEKAVSDANLPVGVEKPKVLNFSTTNQPIMYTTVTAAEGVTEEQLTRFIKDTLLPNLQTIEGVKEVQSIGLQEGGVYIRLNAAKMNEFDITYDQVKATLQANNMSIPLGEATMNDANLPVFVQGNLRSIQQLNEWKLTVNGDVKLKDIADIEQGKDLDLITQTNGEKSVTLNIVKTGNANTVKVADEVLNTYNKAEEDGQIKSLIMYNRATDVKESVNTLIREGALGALFASLLILFFLRNFRATVIAIVSIPVSMLIAMICLKYFTDVTLNIMTLGGLAVATGRVVDDSIVVIENLMRRLKTTPISKEIILEGTAEVGRAITSSTLTTVAVFVPLGLLQGMVGGYFRPFAWTVVFALLSSLLVALTIVPLMTWAFMKNHIPQQSEESLISRGYKRLLRWSLGHKATVLLLAVFLFVGSMVPLFAGSVGVVLLPQSEYKYMFANLTLPKGSDLKVVKAEVDQLDHIIRQHPDVENSSFTVGGSIIGNGVTNGAEWFIGLRPEADLSTFSDDIEAKVHMPEGSEFSLIQDDGSGGNIINVTVTGSSIANVRMATEQITEVVRTLQGTDSVNNNLGDGTKGIAIEVRQEDASKHGLSAIQTSSLLRPYLTEMYAGRVHDGTDTNDLYLALSNVSIASVSDIEKLLLPTPMGGRIQVKDIANVQEVQLPSAIQYKNGSEFATVSAKITEKDVNKVNKDLSKALDNLTLPDGVGYTLGGSNSDIQQMLNDMLMAMLVAVGMVYIVMVIAFREGRAPLAVLFSLPFALSGGLMGTIVTGEPISVSSMIGFLMLIGIVVTNAIVLLERVHQQIEQGMDIREALIEAGGTRLRPILMTAIATICALMPLAIGLGGGSIISSGLAVVVIGGLTISTLLTLIIVPVIYELMYFKRSRQQRLSKEDTLPA